MLSDLLSGSVSPTSYGGAHTCKQVQASRIGFWISAQRSRELYLAFGTSRALMTSHLEFINMYTPKEGIYERAWKQVG